MTLSSANPPLDAWLAQANQQLTSAGITSAKLDSELLASFVLSRPRTWLHAHLEHEITDAEQKQLVSLLSRRLHHEPIAYIVCSKEFFGRDFAVNSSVLVPRPESEAMIEILKSITQKGLSFIDIGTGSGILAITTALEQPSWSGTATDISPEALKVAEQNAKKLETKNLVFKVQSLLANDTEKYDVVIANLPYVPKSLRSKPDIAHEPAIALFADNNGLAIYEEFFSQITTRKHKPTHILTESLIDQHKALEKIASDAGFSLIETKGLSQHFCVFVR